MEKFGVGIILWKMVLQKFVDQKCSLRLWEHLLSMRCTKKGTIISKEKYNCELFPKNCHREVIYPPSVTREISTMLPIDGREEDIPLPRNFCHRNFWWQQKCVARKVQTEKMRFAPRIDIIAQKLAPVTSGKVWEILQFPALNSILLCQCFYEENKEILKLCRRSQARVFELWYRFEVQNAPSRSKLVEIKILLPPEIYTV